ncbi:MAG TPA: NUDIX domain-containing protein [Steroidobacteraceae bacterium]|jgi:predicted NUDIX family NTP pyrophosphohydrolase|nr:NUDIX domain-containing protein [Steroidobacteraceae bacterium]
MKPPSAGILLYRRRQNELQVFLIHMGGPLWAHKDAGAWSIPKGEYGADEEPLQAAQREFHEETGARVSGPFLGLQPIRQRSGKMVSAWATEGEFDPAQLRSNLFTLEWPPGSGRMQQFPEADRGAWFSLAEAGGRIIPGQQGLLAELQSLLSIPPA